MTLLAAFALASCSSDETAEVSADSTIQIEAGVAEASTKAVINSDYNKTLDVVFGRLDNPGYAPAFTTWLYGTRMAGDGSQVVSFGVALKYNSATVRMVGLYPRPEVAVASIASPIAYKITGNEDLMATEYQDGTALLPFKPFTFRHYLTQLQVKCVGSAEAIKAWGAIKSIKVKDVPTNLNMTVDATAAGAVLDVNTNNQSASLSFHNSPTQIVTAEEEKPTIGYCMIYPEKSLGTVGKPVTLEVSTAYDGRGGAGTAKTVTIGNISGGVRKGEAHQLTLIFSTDGEIAIEADIAPWELGSGSSSVIKPS